MIDSRSLDPLGYDVLAHTSEITYATSHYNLLIAIIHQAYRDCYRRHRALRLEAAYWLLRVAPNLVELAGVDGDYFRRCVIQTLPDKLVRDALRLSPQQAQRLAERTY